MTEAVIFDLDGTVLDNVPVWEEAIVNVMKKHDLEHLGQKLLGRGGLVHEPGVSLAANWWRILEAGQIHDSEAERKYVAETAQEYGNLSTDLQLRDGVEDAVALIKERNWRTALSTGSHWFMVEKQLEELGMTLAFEVTTTGEEVYMPKPDPEIYLLTAQKLGVEPENCLAVEDSLAGVRAAKEAGMKVAGLTSGYAPEGDLKAVGADFVIAEIADLKQLISSLE